MIFPSNLTLVGSIIVNHIFVSTTQHWLWIANSGFWFNSNAFWLSGWSCFNQKQPATDYELRSWRELIFLIYFDGPHLVFNYFLDTLGIFLLGAHPSQFWHLMLLTRNFSTTKPVLSHHKFTTWYCLDSNYNEDEEISRTIFFQNDI